MPLTSTVISVQGGVAFGRNLHRHVEVVARGLGEQVAITLLQHDVVHEAVIVGGPERGARGALV